MLDYVALMLGGPVLLLAVVLLSFTAYGWATPPVDVNALKFKAAAGLTAVWCASVGFWAAVLVYTIQWGWSWVFAREELGNDVPGAVAAAAGLVLLPLAALSAWGLSRDRPTRWQV